MILTEKIEIIVLPFFGPVAIELDLRRLKLGSMVGQGDEVQHFAGEAGERAGIGLFEDFIAEEDDGDDIIPRGDRIEAYRRPQDRAIDSIGPINVEVMDVEGVDLIFFQGLYFCAIGRVDFAPIIETHALGPLIAGIEANGKKQDKQSEMNIGHRDEYFYKVKGKESITTKIYYFYIND